MKKFEFKSSQLSLLTLSLILVAAMLIPPFILAGIFGAINAVTSKTTPHSIQTAKALSKPEVSAKSAVVIDGETGKVLFSKNSDEIRAVASLTKVMTTILTLEAGDLDKHFKVDNNAIKVEGTSMGLKENDIVTRRALCYGMMLPSGNDAANVSAVSVGGDVKTFVEMMNEKAKLIGMKNTTYTNPHGLDESGHLSTAYDMAILTSYALKNVEFSEICKARSKQLEFGNPPYKRTVSNNNKLLSLCDDCIGVKTGFTDNARRCLISATKRGEKTLITVTLNAPDDWNDHIKMTDYGFEMTELLYNR